MFKKIFVVCIGSLLLWNILSNSTDGIQKLPVHEKEDNRNTRQEYSSGNTYYSNVMDVEILQKSSLGDLPSLEGYEQMQNEIKQETETIKQKSESITERIQEDISELEQQKENP